MQGYVYDTKADANEASDGLDALFGIPVSATAVTRHAVKVLEGVDDDTDEAIWYITESDYTASLGSPVAINLKDTGPSPGE